MKHVALIIVLTLAVLFFMIGMSFGISEVMQSCREVGEFRGLFETTFTCEEIKWKGLD